MQKDMIEVDASASEIAFVERYWTEVWKREGGPRAKLAAISRKAEFRHLRRWLRHLPPGARVLDGGCGLGDWTAYVNSLGYSACGIDISRETVAQLQRLFPEVEFAVSDIRATAFADASFDLYFSWGVFEHFEEGLQRCIAEARRILKPGGTLLISVPFDNGRQQWLRRRGRAGVVSPAGRFYQWRLTVAELRDELARGGFAVEAVTPIHKRQGVERSLHHELGLAYGLVTRAASAALSPLAPAGLFAHMLLAEARRPA